MEKLLIIDANSLINRAFYAVRFLSAPDKTPTNAVYGFLMTLLKIIADYNPDHIVAAFDLKSPTFRHKMYDGYKAQRKPMPDDLAVQMPIVKEILDAAGILRLEKEGFEADDIIGTVSRICEEKQVQCLIATGDKDDLQLAGDYTTILLTTTRSGVTDTQEYTPKEVFERYGVTPEEFIDVKALMGDPSDNIPGVSGIGEKTALALIAKYKSVENLYEHLDELTGAQLKKLSEGKASADLSKKLATIDKNVPIDFDINSAKPAINESTELYSILSRLGLSSIIKRLNFSKNDTAASDNAKNPIENAVKTVIKTSDELNSLCDKINTAKKVSLIFNTANGIICGIGAAIGSEGFYIGGEFLCPVPDCLISVLSNPEIKKYGFNIKDALVCLYGTTPVKGLCYDLAIAAYLINPARTAYSIGALCLEYFGCDPTSDNKSSQISIFDDDSSDAEDFITQALLIFPLYELTKNQLKDAGQESLYYDVELPLVTVLADMQAAGMYIDKDRLSEFGEMLGRRIDELTEEIYSLCGETFNINSPKQLGEILFERLGLKPAKKTKTGYATGAEVLENLSGKHPVIEKILEYRQNAKLKSTYCDGLYQVISPDDGRIHSVFNQTVTVTGRISSSEPNMQNIPTRTQLGRELRKMFVAPEGMVLVDADYSQIELRVLAAIADDEQMKNAFKTGADIHTETAAQVLKIPFEAVTKEQRSSAKSVNFGIVYGIGEFSLAKELKTSVKEARDYINSYLSHYSGVRDYMERIKAQAKNDGYVTTIMNRKRYIPEIKSPNYSTRQFGERVALNTPIQGSAADIIKLAMVKVHSRLKESGLKARLILQVHDELIIESPKNEEEQVKSILSQEMENAVSLSVPLVVDMSSGRSWYDCK